MTVLWMFFTVLPALAAGLAVLTLRRQRAMLTNNVVPQAPRPSPPVFPTTVAPRIDTGSVYIDTHGHCALVDRGARELLRIGSTAASLSELLAGGVAASSAILDALARDGVIEQPRTAFVGVPDLDLHAVAVRDRDGNLWGAALFLQRPALSRSGRRP